MNIIKFLQESGKLKTLKRAGWVKKEVKEVESVADHTFQVTLMAYLLCPEDMDKEKMIKMSLVNELPEVVTGDIITKHTDKQDFKDAKFQKEQTVIREMVSGLDNKEEIIKLYDESEALQTNESIFLKQLDKLEMAFQALEYEKQSDDMEKFNEKNLMNFGIQQETQLNILI